MFSIETLKVSTRLAIALGIGIAASPVRTRKVAGSDISTPALEAF
jgi:hypothetical protein